MEKKKKISLHWYPKKQHLLNYTEKKKKKKEGIRIFPYSTF